MNISIDYTHLVSSAICGLICLLIAKDKGRTSWWFLAGFILNIFGVLVLAIASNLDKEDRMIRDIEEIKNTLDKKEFLENIRIGSNDDNKICLNCKNYTKQYSICSHYKKEVREIIVDCQYFKKDNH